MAAVARFFPASGGRPGAAAGLFSTAGGGELRPVAACAAARHNSRARPRLRCDGEVALSVRGRRCRGAASLPQRESTRGFKPRARCFSESPCCPPLQQWKRATAGERPEFFPPGSNLKPSNGGAGEMFRAPTKFTWLDLETRVAGRNFVWNSSSLVAAGRLEKFRAPGTTKTKICKVTMVTSAPCMFVDLLLPKRHADTEIERQTLW